MRIRASGRYRKGFRVSHLLQFMRKEMKAPEPPQRERQEDCLSRAVLTHPSRPSCLCSGRVVVLFFGNSPYVRVRTLHRRGILQPAGPESVTTKCDQSFPRTLPEVLEGRDAATLFQYWYQLRGRRLLILKRLNQLHPC
jgi:hypothetical protein